jgi:CubicO group peptidase (beta-lactamase class C family)
MVAIWQDRLDHFKTMIERDIANGMYYGAAVRVGRGGEQIFAEDIGCGYADQKNPLDNQSVYSIFSMTKAFTNILVLRAIERGKFGINTKVSEIIPEFAGAPRDQTTVFHLMTHTTGWDAVWELEPNGLTDKFDEVIALICQRVYATMEPGLRCHYQPVVNHALLGEMVRRTDDKGRSIRDIYREDLFEPLKMFDTAMGVRRDLQSRHIVPDFRGMMPINVPGRTIPGPFGFFQEPDAEAPHVGCVSTADNIYRFAEMLRRGGELDGVRILSPRILEVARQNWTGEMENELYRGLALAAGARPFPAYIGLGFALKGDLVNINQYGTLTHPGTFGNNGAGSTIFWVDPVADVSFVVLTAGVMPEWDNMLRLQRFADTAMSALL